MNAEMRIQVTAEAKQALAQLRAVRKELDAIRNAGRKVSGGGMESAFASAATSAKNATTSTGGFLAKLKKFPAAMAGLGASMVKVGKNLQWVGRQMEFRLTLPLVALAAAGWKFAMDFETAMTRVRKVYGDTSMSIEQVNKDVDKIQKGFIALSNIYGVHADEVANIGAVYAQAGAEGAALVEMTQATIQAMILGNLSVEESTRGIITIMDSYKLSASELTDTLALLNVVENESPANMQDLIEAFEKTGATARVAGVSISELAAMVGTLIPSAGTASEVGNSLKTTILRVMAPTKQAAAAIKSLGANMESAAWKSATFNERLDQLADGWRKLGQEQKLQAARDIAGLRQGNRFLLLMEDRISATSEYYSLLQKVGDADQNTLAFNRELETYLTSAPQQWEILTNRMRNMLMQVMLPLLPAINNVVAAFAKLAQKFESLSPKTQQWILLGALALAALGPIVAYMGIFSTVIGSVIVAITKLGAAFLFLAKSLGVIGLAFGKVVAFIGAAMTGLLGFIGKLVVGAVVALKGLPAAFIAMKASVLASIAAMKVSILGFIAAVAAAPWYVIAGAVAAVLLVIAALFSDTGREIIGTVADWISGLWRILVGGINGAITAAITGAWALPREFARALQGLINVVAAAVRIVREWLSYLNPFARHSPSLVDNVRNGVKVIGNEFKRLTNVVPALNRVADAIGRIGKEFAAAAKASAAADLAEKIRLAGFAGVSPDAFNEVIASIQAAEAAMTEIDNEIKAHEQTIKSYEQSMAALDAEIAEHDNTIKGYEQSIAAIDVVIKGHQQTIKGYEQDQKAVTAAMKQQQLAIDAVQESMDALDVTIEQETDRLAVLQAVLGRLNDELSEAQSRLADYQNTPIAGTYAFEDAIFTNTQDQNQLKLQLALLSQQALDAGYSIDELRSARDALRQAQEEATQVNDELVDSTDSVTAANDALNGSFDTTAASADDVRNRMALLAGEIEGLRGESLSLRLAGAGSDVLAGLDQQVGIIDAARRSLAVVLGEKVATGGGGGAGGGDTGGGDTGGVTGGSNIPTGLFGIVDQVDAVQRELDKVSISGEILGLQRGLALDPGNKAISDLSRTPEMSVGAIISGITSERANIAGLENEIANVNTQIAAQEGVIESLNQDRAVLEASYDAEVDKLDLLQDSYDAIQEKIEAVQETISGLNDEQEVYRDLIAGEEAVIAGITDQYDAYQAKIDEVNASIDALSASYDELATARDNATDTLDTAVDLGKEIEDAQKAADAAAAASGSGGGGGGVGGVGGDFDVPGGAGGFGSDTDLDALIADLQAQSDALFDDINPFGGFRERLQSSWDDLMEWFNGKKEEYTTKLQEIWDDSFGKLDIAGKWQTWIIDPITTGWNWLRDTFDGPLEAIKRDFWDPFWENVVVPIGKAIASIWAVLGPFWEALKNLFLELVGFFERDILPIIEGFGIAVGLVFTALYPIIKTAWEIITIAIGAAITIIGGIITGLIEILTGIINFIVGVFTGDWERAWLGIQQIVSGIWTIINTIVVEKWTAIWGFVKSIWENIAKPIFEGIWNWMRDTFGPGLSVIWDGITGFFGDMWFGMQWAWEGAIGWLSGIWGWFTGWGGLVVSAFLTVGGGFVGLFTDLSGTWENIKGIFSGAWSWIEDNFVNKMTGMPGIIQTAFGGIARIAGNALTGLSGAISGGINAAIGVVNSFANGVNRITRFFGLGNLVPTIGTVSGGSFASGNSGGSTTITVGGSGPGSSGFAQGGIPPMEVGSGGLVNRARAIVGEGVKGWPEYVIPTDPRHRGRALELAQSLVGRIGLPTDGTRRGSRGNNMPAFAASGGIFGGDGAEQFGIGGLISNTLSSIKNKGIKLIKEQVRKLWLEIYDDIRWLINQAPGSGFAGMGKGAATYLLKKADEWITGVFLGLPSIEKVVTGATTGVSAGFSGNPGGGGGSTSWGNYVPPTIYSGPHANGGLLQARAFMNGGIVKGGRGGIISLIGEGRHDEAVIPLDGREFGRTVNIYGDVSLPDVTNVDEFLANLEAIGS